MYQDTIPPHHSRLQQAGVASSTGRPVALWLCATLLFVLAVISSARWTQGLALLPEAVRQSLATGPLTPATLVAAKASLFLAGLLLLCRSYIATVVRSLAVQIQPDDPPTILLTMLALLVLDTGLTSGNLGLSYMAASLNPFDQDTDGLYRRILEPALAYYLHLNGVLFVLFHYVLTGGLLILLRLFFRAQGVNLGVWELVSLGTCSFVLHNFQNPGYPDVLVIGLALTLLVVELPPSGRAAVTVLALLSHEMLAMAIFLPLALRWPWRDRLAVGGAVALYVLVWLVESHFRWAELTHQVSYFGRSGPHLLRAHPLAVAFGVVVAFKLVWGAMAVHMIGLWRRGETWALALASAPLAAAAALAYLSFDTSRIVEVAFPTALFSLAAVWPSLGRRTRLVWLAANLILPSPYVSPAIDGPLGMNWQQGLYAAYNGFDLRASLVPPDPPPAIGDR